MLECAYLSRKYGTTKSTTNVLHQNLLESLGPTAHLLLKNPRALVVGILGEYHTSLNVLLFSMESALRRDINVLEAVQRRCTKCFGGLRDKPYNKRLSKLHTLSLENQRTLADMRTTYKLLHQKIKCSAADVGLTFRQTNT